MFKNIFRRESSAPKRTPMKAHIRLQNDGIVVHPGDSDSGSEDTTMVSGVFTLESDSSINVCGTRIAFVVQYRYKRPGKDVWEEGILYEHGETFICGDKRDAIHVQYKEQGGLIQREIRFAIVVPKDIATYEYLEAGGIIQPMIRVSVELDNVDWAPDELRALPLAPPEYVDDGTIVIQNHKLVTERWSGGSVIPDNVTWMSKPTITSGSLSPGSTAAHQVQTWIKNFLISANPNPTMGPISLRCHKRGVAPGIGEWNAYLWSDSFSVGSYVLPRIEFSHMATACNIYSIELHLVQTYSIIPFEEFKIGVYDPEEYQYPTDTFPLHSHGEKPMTNRPGTEVPALWRGTSQPDGEDVKRFTWEADQVRLPVAQCIRPSTCPATKSPILLKHKFVLKVYFSVTGETVSGEQIPDAKGVGHLRLLIVNLPQHLPSCTCVAEWVTLPGYDEFDAPSKPDVPVCASAAPCKKGVPVCACCYKTQRFPVSTFAKAFPVEELEQREREAPLPTQCKSPVTHTAGSL